MLKRIKLLWEENPQLLFGIAIIVGLFLCSLVGLFQSYDPVVARMKGVKPHQLPSWQYWLGTDYTGQSLMVLLVEGTGAFFLPGWIATFVALLGGGLMGSFSGYYGGWLSHISRYISTLINSFPNLILVILCTTVFGPNIFFIAALVGISFVPHIAEEIRRKVSQLKAEEFVMAAEAHGLRDRRILFFHIVWLHCSPLILRQIVFLWGYLIILETSLNYLGRGVLQRGISWGKLLYDYRSGLFRSQYWSPIVVTLTVMITMAGFYFLAEGLQRWSEGQGMYFDEQEADETTSPSL
ncbi:MAG TPA: hypothetical protein DCE42_00795 [Myxococcales bacterium]|nr:hypothetical protein [Deltaproteobacteria bacterium]HAA53257.1 hypothetical protein [Myxococcales bacterium]